MKNKELGEMDLSIIIVNWNTKEMLKNCISSILENSNGLNVEIIVVDNASSDGSGEMVKDNFPNVKLIDSGGNIGFARANNLAIPHVKSQHILFLNPDTIVGQNALNKMHDFLIATPSIGALGCKIINAYGRTAELPLQIEVSPFKKLFLQLFFSGESANLVKKIFPHQNSHQSGYLRNLFGACIMVRKKVLDEVGYFDEQFFMYAEDIDLCHRIFRHGWKLYYLSEAEILHFEGGASQKAPSDFSTRMMCESVSKLMYKNYGKIGRLIYKIGLFAGSLIRLALLIILSIGNKSEDRRRKTKYSNSIYKHMLILKWTLMTTQKGSPSQQ